MPPPPEPVVKKVVRRVQKCDGCGAAFTFDGAECIAVCEYCGRPHNAPKTEAVKTEIPKAASAGTEPISSTQPRTINWNDIIEQGRQSDSDRRGKAYFGMRWDVSMVLAMIPFVSTAFGVITRFFRGRLLGAALNVICWPLFFVVDIYSIAMKHDLTFLA